MINYLLSIDSYLSFKMIQSRLIFLIQREKPHAAQTFTQQPHGSKLLPLRSPRKKPSFNSPYNIERASNYAAVAAFASNVHFRACDRDEVERAARGEERASRRMEQGTLPPHPKDNDDYVGEAGGGLNFKTGGTVISRPDMTKSRHF